MTNREVVAGFLLAYQHRNAQSMEAFLDPQVQFSDMAFPSIQGEQVRAMWRWFCRSSDDPSDDRPNPVDMPGFEIRGRLVTERWPNTGSDTSSAAERSIT